MTFATLITSAAKHCSLPGAQRPRYVRGLCAAKRRPVEGLYKHILRTNLILVGVAVILPRG